MVPYLRCANVLDGNIDYSDVNRMHFSRADQERYTLRPGDILLNEGQSTELVGRSAIYQGPEGRYCYQNSLVNFRCGPAVVPRFAQAVFKRWLDVGHFGTIVKQTTSMAHLGGGRFSRLEFPIAPLPEQRQIAAILDTLDDAIRKTEQIIAKLKQVKQGLLHDLLTRGIDDNGELRCPERHPEQFKDSALGRIPRGWELAKLGELAEVDRGKFTQRPRNDPAFYGGPYPFIQTGDVAAAEGGVLRTASQSLNHRGIGVSREFPAGTIAITIAANIADTTILGVPMYFPDSLVGAVVRAPNSVRFIQLCIQRAKRTLDARAPQSAQKNINLQDLRPLLVPHPSAAEQEQVAHRYDVALAVLAAEELSVTKLRLLKAGLMEDLLTGRVRVTNLVSSP